ncbi:alpha-N-acetylgalactosaminide alpha-2,6-sialyltransferase 1 [Ctenodactylus gundi]
MRPCPRRLCCPGRGVLGPLLLALLVLVLFFLPSFIKEPSTRPSRYQHRENHGKWSPELLQLSVSQVPARDRALDAHPGRVARLAGEDKGVEVTRGPGQEEGTTAAVLCTLDKDRTTAGTLPPGSQRREMASVRSLQRQDTGPPRRAADQKGKLTMVGTGLERHQGAAVTPARTLSPQSQDRVLATANAVKTRLGKEAMTTAAAAARGWVARTSPPPARAPRATTQVTQELKAANFRAEPRWDFEEEYTFDVGGLRTTCPDSLKLRAASSPWLQRLFLPNLTLFLDARHFSQSEWRRLEHFAPPFGFMELNSSLVQKVVTHLPPVPQQQLLLADLPAGSSRCVTCAVVGNGGILNDSHVGREIDSHDYVFRLSGAVIKGHEQDVGTRTSFYGFTAFSLTQSLLILGSRGFQHAPLGTGVRYLHFPESARDYEWLEAMLFNQTLTTKNLFWFRRRPQEAFRNTLRLDKYLLLHPDFLRYAKNRFLRSKTLDSVHWRIYRPTTGALLLLTALQLCDKVSAYGFITEGHERFSDHYYDKSWKKLVFYTNHDFKLERDVWKRLHDAGIIRLYQRPQATEAGH